MVETSDHIRICHDLFACSQSSLILRNFLVDLIKIKASIHIIFTLKNKLSLIMDMAITPKRNDP